MNFPESDSPMGSFDTAFGAHVMGLILDLGPAPISAIGILAMSSGVSPYAASGAMAMIQAAGFVEVQDEAGNVVIDPNDGVTVALTPMGLETVLRCRKLDADERADTDKGNPNYN